MSQPLPADEVQFLRAAVQQHYVTPEQARQGLELRRRYQDGGAQTPSLARILVQGGQLTREVAEALWRHVLAGAALPPPAGPPKPASATPVAPIPPVAAARPEDVRKGMGAYVSPGEIKGYKLLAVIGRGAMGTVYRAQQLSMERVVALKVLAAAKTRNQAFVELFLAEARDAGRLNHPNLIRVHEVNRSGDLYYYSMEFVDGTPLNELMDDLAGGQLPPRRALQIFAQVAAALDHGYRQGIIHRELRPNNILVTESDQAKLEDLGLTRDEHTRFLDGENAHYVAPEQVSGDPVDTRADLYSLGCCLYHALTGEAPFRGAAPKDVLQQHLEAPVPDPRTLNPRLPAPVANVCMKLMARAPAARYQTPAELMGALKLALFALPAVPSPQPGAAKGPPAAGRHPRGRGPSAPHTRRR